jgi:hypothetical protein
MARYIKSPWKVTIGLALVLWGVGGLLGFQFSTSSPSASRAAVVGDLAGFVILWVVLFGGVALIRAGWPHR